jgi:cell fate (sporulation/competence/biofilm development) regulator YmcA (YheA/YmcA/DUF963 family)
MRELLETAEALGAKITESPQVKSFKRAFESDEDLAQRLRELTGHVSLLRSSPLLVAVRLQHYGRWAEDLIKRKEDEDWFDDALKLGITFQVMVEFLRSRLPGYPVLKVPHRAKGSPYLIETNYLFFHHFPWERDLARTGIQQKEGHQLDGLFEAPGGIGGLLTRLANQARDRPSWRRFIAASAALDPDDKGRLSDLNKEFRARTREEVVDAESGELMMANYQYRQAVLAEMVGSCEGRVLEYLRSFEEVDELITLIATTIEAVIMESKLTRLEMRRLDLGRGLEARPFQGLANLKESFLEPGTPVLVNAAGIEGVVYPTTLTMSFDGEARLQGKFFALTD